MERNSHITEDLEKYLGPYRVAKPEEKYDPDHVVPGSGKSGIVKLIPTRIYPENDCSSKSNENFCQEPSERYLTQLANAGDDPRVAAEEQALRDLERTGGWAPTLDARDARVEVRES